MRFSRLFGQTLREAPGGVDDDADRLLARAGFFHPVKEGVYAWLPLGCKALAKIEVIARKELGKVGGQQILMPGTFCNRGYDPGLLARGVRSSRQLPILIYQFRSGQGSSSENRGGLTAWDGNTYLEGLLLETDKGAESQYETLIEALKEILNHCGLPIRRALVGGTGFTTADGTGLFYPSSNGAESIVACAACNYSHERKTARLSKKALSGEALNPLQKVATPHCRTIEELAAFLGVPAARTAKAVFLMADLNLERGSKANEEFIFVVIRGDMDVDQTKIRSALGARSIRPAAEAEILRSGAVPGYASPVGLKGVRVVVDDLVPVSPNLVAGANKNGFHLLNVNFGRDFTADLITDLALVKDGSPCPDCGQPLESYSATEIAWVDRFIPLTLDENSPDFPLFAGSFSISLERILACAAKEHHDATGLVWPASIAPYQVQLVGLKSKTGQAEAVAETLFKQLETSGVGTLFDDRTESAGVKFFDADLIGLPLRITVGERGLEKGGVEFKTRAGGESFLVELDEVVTKARLILAG